MCLMPSVTSIKLVVAENSSSIFDLCYLSQDQVRLLLPLQELCSVSQLDVRQRQLECVLQILQNNAEQLTDGWPLILGVISEVTNGQGKAGF